MKPIRPILLFLLALSIYQSPLSAQEPLQRAQLADSAYRIADYEQAASLYEEVLASGFASPVPSPASAHRSTRGASTHRSMRSRIGPDSRDR